MTHSHQDSSPLKTQLHSKDKCQICGDSLARNLISKSRDYKGNKFESSWVECMKCDSAHIDPYPTEEQLHSYYRSGYVEMDFDGTVDKNSNHKLHYSTEYEKVVFENYHFSLKDAKFSNDDLHHKFILDYGCANGIFYKFLTEIYGISKTNIYGVDIESDMLESCRKISPNFYSTKQIDKIERRFDLITMLNVIEHIYDPKLALKSIINLLKDDGEMFIETPMYGPLAKKLGKDWSHFIVIEHINLFSRSAIKKMFDDFGMKCISESSFGANIFGGGAINPNVKRALDQMAKEKDFGATQVLRFKKK
jgi:2-polyprenyl-3-methyl-5-hydroxy-6-metoxy-1,4-benzoquinol methylase